MLKSTAIFVNKVANIGLEIDDKEEKVNVCKGMELYAQEMKILGALEVLQDGTLSDEEIIEKIVKKFEDVTEDDVKAIIESSKVSS